jgi:hypothetical protein
MASNHTKGPWAIADDQFWKEGHQPVILSEHTRICSMPALSTSGGARNARRHEIAANAKLIAAAPDMLSSLQEALEQLRQLMEGEGCDHSVGICYCATFRAMNDAAEAIHKATT